MPNSLILLYKKEERRISYAEKKQIILSELDTALSGINADDAEFLAEALCGGGKVFVIGVGRVMLMLQAFAKRMNHLGIPANYVGAIDEPAITEGDVLLVGSGSGETAVPVAIAKIAQRYEAKVIHIGANPRSTMTEYENVFIRIPCATKLSLPNEVASQQIMSSLFEQSLLLFLDAVAMMVAEKKGIRDLHTLWRYHANLE
ncbi:6-phospho-3-hexuloisomerase [Selenomonas sp. TAMA-11512]|uniref:6-phospho-3-hexuloisomerase n=1 Tax=Selenomonas sp. TAMA-11512 TaxID=3095337 RepID=UPI0030938F29|nr:6-phospho-3-hexuloisomerase [Selenomonas sp. TAMA-11512]